MTDIVSNIQKFQIEESSYLNPLSWRLFRKIGACLNGLIDAFSSSVVIGEIKQSILSEETFQSRRGAGWVLMKGQDITGSEYHTLYGISVLPSMPGAFPRCSDPSASVDPDGASRIIFSAQTESILTHNHQTTYWSTAASSGALKDFPSQAFQEKDNAVDSFYLLEGNTSSPRGLTSTSGDFARPRNYSINYFIRINE